MANTNMTFEEEVIDRLARIETSALALNDHEVRIRKVENRQTTWLGGAGVIGLVGGYGASLFSGHLKFW